MKKRVKLVKVVRGVGSASGMATAVDYYFGDGSQTTQKVREPHSTLSCPSRPQLLRKLSSDKGTRHLRHSLTSVASIRTSDFRS
jgi:hypothetical protein